MQITVTCTVSIADELIDINVLEAEIREAGQRVMAEMMGQAWQQYQTLAPDCGRCQSEHTVGDGTRLYRLRTVFGIVELQRQRRRCRDCRAVYQPSDEVLRAAGPGRATAGLVEAAVLAGSSWPFVTAADVLKRLSGASVSPEWIRWVSEAQGAVLGQQQADEAEALHAGEVPLPQVDPAPEQLLLELDGGWVCSQDNARGMEGKVAVLATGREQIGRNRWRLTGRRYVARFQPSEPFGVQVFAAAAEQGVAQADRVVVLGDGAEWITSITDMYLPEAERRLDLWHLLKRSSEAVAAEDLTDEMAATLRTELNTLLRRGAVAEAEALVAEHLSGMVAQAFGGYLHNQRDWIVDAETLRANGELVGSGAVEKAVDLVLNRRFKGRRGMRWWRVNADAITVLRTRILNNEPLAA